MEDPSAVAEAKRAAAKLKLSIGEGAFLTLVGQKGIEFNPEDLANRVKRFVDELFVEPEK